MMKATIRLTVLRLLEEIPEGYMQEESALIRTTQLIVQPCPSRAEVEAALRELDSLRLITGVRNRLDGLMRWKITDAGKAEYSMF